MDVREIFRPLFGPIPFQVEVTWNEDIETPGQLHYVTDIVGAQNCRLCVTSPTGKCVVVYYVGRVLSESQ